jgi:hypothetical protein
VTKRTALLLLLLLLLLPAFCPAEEAQQKKEYKPLNSLQKSLLIPGWGQAAEKHYAEGFLFFAGEVFCLYGFFDQNHKGNDSYALYRAAGSREDAVRYRRQTEAFDTGRNRFLLAAAAVWALNLADIHWIVSGQGHDRSGRSISLRLDCGENQSLAVALSYRY